MTRRHWVALISLVLLFANPAIPQAKRVVIVKLDGVPHDLLERELRQINPATGKSNLPWIDHIFVRQGTRLENFYVRAISLSAPSWSLLDTGQHLQIRGNAEFDRYTNHVYDYLNFFPFYLGYALSNRVDMPGVEVLDRLGIPLLIDRFAYPNIYQGFQLYQRGVRWKSLQHGLQRHFSRSPRDLLDEWTMGFEIGSSVEAQMERELIQKLADPQIEYLDYFTGEFDHVAHLTPDAASQRAALVRIDSLIGRIWTAIQSSPAAPRTVLVVVSDHGMNTDPTIYSQGYDLVEFLNSRAGGAHHVITDRHPMTEFKLKGLDPFVSEVVTPSEDSLYLKGASKDYPTAQVDLDGNERASVYLRNSDLNALHILLGELAHSDAESRARLMHSFFEIIERHRAAWQKTIRELREELAAVHRLVEAERVEVESQPKKWTPAERDEGLDKAARRVAVRMNSDREDERCYLDYALALEKLLALTPADFEKRTPSAEDLIPKRAMGDPNTIHDLRSYVIGPAPGGGFQTIDYFPLLAALTVRNNVQSRVSARPVDFIVVRLPQPPPAEDAILLYGDETHQAIIESKHADGELSLRYVPAEGLHLAQGFPLRLLEDQNLAVPSGDRAAWLSSWHTEREWFRAVHKTEYSNGIIALHEQFLRAPEPRDPIQRFNARRRRLAEPDFMIFASDHWNFNVRGFNPGGNHGSLRRISMHSVLMLAGGDDSAIARDRVVLEPYDSLSFVPTILDLMGLHQKAAELPGKPIRELFP